ncbi:hypothetical protein NCS52_01524400 [Fusarium sp. LHS14.1]|nr:hypothetical protein NCS52_01524400 [Fusarium sp. LHS14.1]
MAAVPTTIRALLHEHSTNPVKDTLMESSSNKQWAKTYHPIKHLVVHTQTQGLGVVGTFDRAFLGEYDDENLRLNEPAYPPNYRNWRMDTEQDAIAWFNAEVSNVVLSAFAVYPGVINCGHEKPLSSTRTDETVDTSYSIDASGGRTNFVIGEFKRGTLKRARWQAGSLGSGQESLSRELRGYAHKYECPHIFCFDGYTLLLLQFQAKSPNEIKDAKCVVDCWVFPRDNPHGTPLRHALYRFLVQGFRRCQGMRATKMSLYGVRPTLRLFYSGLPLWKLEDGNFYANPWGHERKLDASCGAFYWTDKDGRVPLLGGDNNWVWDTESFWQTLTQQSDGDSVPMVVEDLYGPD